MGYILYFVLLLFERIKSISIPCVRIENHMVRCRQELCAKILAYDQQLTRKTICSIIWNTRKCIAPNDAVLFRMIQIYYLEQFPFTNILPSIGNVAFFERTERAITDFCNSPRSPEAQRQRCLVRPTASYGRNRSSALGPAPALSEQPTSFLLSTQDYQAACGNVN